MGRARAQEPLDPDLVARARAIHPPARAAPELARLQQVVCDDARARIVGVLRAGPLAVVDLALVIGRAPETTSQHLRVLRAVGVVEGERRGHRVYYRLRDGGTSARVVRVLEDLEKSA